MVPEKNRTIGLLSRDLHSKDLHMSLMRDLLTRKKILLTCGHRNTNKSDQAVTDPLNMNRLAHLMRNRLKERKSLPTRNHLVTNNRSIVRRTSPLGLLMEKKKRHTKSLHLMAALHTTNTNHMNPMKARNMKKKTITTDLLQFIN